jgi:hypothetical protein
MAAEGRVIPPVTTITPNQRKLENHQRRGGYACPEAIFSSCFPARQFRKTAFLE